MTLVRSELMGTPTDTVPGEHRIRALTLSNLRELLGSYGAELSPILQNAELRPDVVEDDLAWISLEKFARVLTIAARVTGDPCFGLKYGSVTRFTSNPLGYLMANAPDLKTALRAFAHFQPMLSSTKLEFLESTSGGRLEWSYPVTMRTSSNSPISC